MSNRTQIKTAGATLAEQLYAAGIPTDCVRQTGTQLTIVYSDNATPQQINTGNSMLAAFDASDIAQENRNNMELKNVAVDAFLNDSSMLTKIVRALSLVLLDEINLLRSAALVGTSTLVWDAPNIANGVGATSPNITVLGAQIGDVVDVRPPASTAGLIVYGYVSAPNIINIRIHNGTGAAINIASGAWGVSVRRPSVLGQRTIKELQDAVQAKINIG